MTLNYIAIPTADAQALRAGGPDAYGMPAERVSSSTGTGTPCRHCLAQVPSGKPYLIAAYRPFGGLNSYTETGPIFICADDCTSGSRTNLPTAMLGGASYILRGYSTDERIIYGTGCIVAQNEISDRCEEILADAKVDFVHIRFSTTNCFQCRVERA